MPKIDLTKNPQDDVPMGAYKIKCVKCALGRNKKSGDQRWELTFSIEDKNPRFTVYWPIEGEHWARAATAKKIEVLGLNAENDLSEMDFIGIECFAQLETKPNEFNGETRDQVNIAKYEGSTYGLWPLASPPAHWEDTSPF